MLLSVYVMMCCLLPGHEMRTSYEIVNRNYERLFADNDRTRTVTDKSLMIF